MTLLRARAEEDVSLMTTRSPRDGDDPTLLGLRYKTAAQKERCIIHSTQLNESLSTRLTPSSTASSAATQAEAEAHAVKFFFFFRAVCVLNCSAQVVGGTSSKDHGAATYN